MGLPDRKNAGRSRLVPFRKGEDASTRHSRRLGTNLRRQQEVRRWCHENGISLRITNDGHHWQFIKTSFVAEWWPSSAKLVINKRWDDGVHCHDHCQAMKIIAHALATPSGRVARSDAPSNGIAEPKDAGERG